MGSSLTISMNETPSTYHSLWMLWSSALLNISDKILLPETKQYYHYFPIVYDEQNKKEINGLHLVLIELPKFKPQTCSEKKMHVHIPLVLLGDSVGVRTENGVLEQQLRGVEVVCLPRDVIEDFTVDVSPLHVGEDIKVSALGLDPEKYTLVTHGDLVVANVAAGEVEVKAADAAAPAPEANKKGGKKK